jgi:REP element-mobilizing transposase RayT
MSLHSYTRCWVHLIWATHNREKTLHKEARVKVSGFLREYSEAKQIYMRTNFVNADHVHAVIDLPTGMDIEEAVKLLKGSSSHWINKNRVVPGKFSWGRGYGAFSVSQSRLEKTEEYISGQEEHHRTKTFTEEYEAFIRAYSLSINRDENR